MRKDICEVTNLVCAQRKVDYFHWIISCELLFIKRQRFGKVKGEAHVDGKLVCAGELMFSLVD